MFSSPPAGIRGVKEACVGFVEQELGTFNDSLFWGSDRYATTARVSMEMGMEASGRCIGFYWLSWPMNLQDKYLFAVYSAVGLQVFVLWCTINR